MERKQIRDVKQKISEYEWIKQFLSIRLDKLNLNRYFNLETSTLHYLSSSLYFILLK